MLHTFFMITNDFLVSNRLQKLTIDNFMIFKRNNGWSERMITRARARLTVFCDDLEEVFQQSVTIADYTELMAWWEELLTSRGLSERTTKEYISLANQFMKYAGVTEGNVADGRSLDLTGYKFGDLEVIERTGNRSISDRSVIWRCQCKCGKFVEIPATQLRKGYHTSCGCQKVKRLQEANQYIEGTSLRMVFSDTVRSDNTSGCKGVYLKNGRWAARIQYKGKRYYLGTFERKEDAVLVRKEAEEKIREEAQKL